MSDHNDPRRLIVFGIACSVAAVLLVIVAYHARAILLLAYVSGLLAMGISPLVQWFERRRVSPTARRLPRWLAILLIYGAIVATFAAILSMVIPPIVDQADELRKTLPEKIDQAQQTLIRLGILRRPITLREAVEQAPATSGTTAVNTIFGAVKNVVGGIFGVITLLLLTFYMLVESQDIFSSFVKLFPRGRRVQVTAIIEAVTTKVSAWLGGQLLLSLIIGSTSAIGLGLMGVPYFFVLALITAIGELIPMVGPILSAIPAILVAVTVSPALAAGVALFFILQQQLENHVLVPKVMGRQVGLSAVTVIVSLGIGGQLLGVVGAILAVPSAAIVQVLVGELVRREEELVAPE